MLMYRKPKLICTVISYFIQHCLKGQCHEIDIFFEGLNILISTFCVCADVFLGLSKAFHYPVK
jgi:hypothetical protein